MNKKTVEEAKEMAEKFLDSIYNWEVANDPPIGFIYILETSEEATALKESSAELKRALTKIIRNK